MATNVTCREYSAESIAAGLTDGFRVYNGVVYFLTVIVVFGSAALWYKWRKKPYLAKRNPDLLAVVGVFTLFQATFVGALPRWLDGIYVTPCIWYGAVFLFVFPCTIWPQATRILLFHNKVIYNRQLALENFKRIEGEQLTKEKVSAYTESTQLIRLKAARYFASKRFGYLVTYIPIAIMFAAAIVVAATSTCLQCIDEIFQTWTVVSLGFICSIGILIGIFNGVLLWTVRKEPDPLKIKRETKMTWSVCLIIGFSGMGLGLVDPFGFLDMDPIPYSFYSLLDITNLLFFTGVVPLQLWFASRPSESPDAGGLLKILGDSTGRHYFGLHLATELALENLFFWNSVRHWLSEYESRDKATRFREGYEIYFQFVRQGAEHQVNISGRARSVLDAKFDLTARADDNPTAALHRSTNISSRSLNKLNRFSRIFTGKGDGSSRNNMMDGLEVTDDVFADALREVQLLMEHHCYPRFKRSKLYKQYLGEEDPDDEEIVNSKVDVSAIIPRLGSAVSNPLKRKPTSTASDYESMT